MDRARPQQGLWEAQCALHCQIFSDGWQEVCPSGFTGTQLPTPKNILVPSSLGSRASPKGKGLNLFSCSGFRLARLARWLGTVTVPECQQHGQHHPKPTQNILCVVGLRRRHVAEWGVGGGVGLTQEEVCCLGLGGNSGAWLWPDPRAKALLKQLVSTSCLSPDP